MTLATIGAASAACILFPAAASALLSELGHTSTPVQPTCPSNPCLAISRTTGFQSRVPSSRVPFVAPRPGKIVAWTITLGKPTRKQITFFNTNEGGPASAGITILRKPPQRVRRRARNRPKPLTFRVIDQSPVVALQKYFGMSAQFPLDRTLTVRKGDIVALTVPTWAPALAVGFRNDTSWRASRQKAHCNDTTTQTAQRTPGQGTQYTCLYRTARVAYSVTLVSTP